jgi:hypothetical protein
MTATFFILSLHFQLSLAYVNQGKRLFVVEVITTNIRVNKMARKLQGKYVGGRKRNSYSKTWKAVSL